MAPKAPPALFEAEYILSDARVNWRSRASAAAFLTVYSLKVIIWFIWKVETTDDFDEWFAGLGIAEQDEIDAKVYLLKRMGPLLKRPHADTLKGSQYNNMKELRGKTPGSVIRIVFAFDPLKSAILLVGGSKRGVNEKRFYKQLIARADALYARHLARVEKRVTDERAERKGKGD